MRFESKIRGVVREKMGVGPQNRSFWAPALEMLTYEQPMGSYKLYGAILHSFEAKIRGVVQEKMGI